MISGKAIFRWGAAFAPVTLFAAPAQAQLPDPVRAMIEAAIATGDPQKVATVIQLAEQTNPDDTAEIESIQGDFLQQQARIAVERQKREKRKIREAGLFEHWNGKGQIGAFQSSGNSNTVGISASLGLKREGLDWTHKLSSAVDYQRSNGETTREQVLVAYEPRYQFTSALFVFGLAQYEHDPIQGFSSRYALSSGIGGNVFDRDRLHLAIKTGPSWRRTNYITQGDESHFAGLAALNFDWQALERISLSEDASVVIESGNANVKSTSAVEAGISDKLNARVSYTVNYDSDPAPGAVHTDTLTRFTLVYDF